ncbi:hypothetical protein PF871_003687 [Escherichia coli]|nr:hypothetical protein [Escherichia coli]
MNRWVERRAGIYSEGADGHLTLRALNNISREVYTLLRNPNRQINSIPITS